MLQKLLNNLLFFCVKIVRRIMVGNNISVPQVECSLIVRVHLNCYRFGKVLYADQVEGLEKILIL